MRAPFSPATARWIAAALLSFAAAAASAQPRWLSEDLDGYAAPYDGRFAFARLRWNGGEGFGGYRWRMSNAWNHDFPRAEQNLARILKELTYIDVRPQGSRIVAIDDPELFNYPIAYMWEPGFWTMTDEEAGMLRAYLQKGGFAIFDDFEQEQWDNFEQQMRRVLPDGRFVQLDQSHQIFDVFFRMKTIEFPHPMMGLIPTYFGIFEDNDPSKRVMVIANYNNDVAEYWEWSDTGFMPIDLSNEAYKLGVNYMIYGFTH
jgi:hypothetical protein